MSYFKIEFDGSFQSFMPNLLQDARFNLSARLVQCGPLSETWIPFNLARHSKLRSSPIFFESFIGSIIGVAAEALADPILKTQLEDCGELLPVMIDNQASFLFNCTKKIAALDESKTDYTFSGSVNTPVFKKELDIKEWFFRVDGDSDIYVTDYFRMAFLRRKWTGLKFRQLPVAEASNVLPKDQTDHLPQWASGLGGRLGTRLPPLEVWPRTALDLKRAFESCAPDIRSALNKYAAAHSSIPLLFCHVHAQYAEVHLYFSQDISAQPYDDMVGRKIDNNIAFKNWPEISKLVFPYEAIGEELLLPDGSIKMPTGHHEFDELVGKNFNEFLKTFLAKLEPGLRPGKVIVLTEEHDFGDEWTT